MNIQAYLIIDSRKKLRMTKGKPAMKANEIAVKPNIGVPDSLFKRPVAQLNLVKMIKERAST